MNYVTFSNEPRDTDNVETLVKQRCTKKIMKFTQKPRYKQKETEFFVNLIIPRTLRLKQYFRANYDIQLCLDTYDENTLGELSTNIFSIGYACSQTEIYQDKLRFLFSERDLQNISIEEACDILEKVNMNKAKENIMNFVNYHQNTLNINWSTPEEIKAIENYALQFPYECYIYRFHSSGSKIVQYQLNEKYLELMGITKEMYLKFESETKTLPCAIKVISYLDVWNQVFGAVSQGLQEYQMELQNYNGQRSYVNIEQKKIFLICPHDHQQYCLVYWIYKTQTSSEIAQQNYQDILDQLNPKPKQCTYRLKEM